MQMRGPPAEIASLHQHTECVYLGNPNIQQQDAGMLFSFCIILFNKSVKILIQCVSFPRFFKKSGFIPSGPADFFFICCVTSAVVIWGSSMYPILCYIFDVGGGDIKFNDRACTFYLIPIRFLILIQYSAGPF